MKKIAVRAATLCAAAIVLVHGIADATASALSTEQLLATAEYTEGIERFWYTTAAPGHFAREDGVKIAYTAFRLPAESEKKGGIVISSGRTESLLKYKELVYDLWRNGYSVYIHDHRGQGLSEREAEARDDPERGHVVDFRSYVADLRWLLQYVAAKEDGRNIFLLSHSMGAAIAARLLQEQGEQTPVRAAVFSSPMFQIRLAGFAVDARTCGYVHGRVAKGRGGDYVVGGTGYKPREFSSNRYTTSAIRYRRLLAEYDRTPQIRLGSPTYGWFAQACGAASLARAGGDKVNVPVLVFRAGNDAIVHARGSHEFCEGVRSVQPVRGCDGDGGGPIVVHGAKHELFIERDEFRNPVVGRILEFFDGFRVP